MSALISKPGLTNASTGTVPMTWSPSWFKGFVSNLLQGGDVRNATSPTGTIKIGGNVSTPYGTIDLNTAANFTFTGDITINPAFGTPLTVEVGGTKLFVVNGTTAPVLQGYGPTAGGLVDMTFDFGSFTGTFTGFTTVITGTCFWIRAGRFVLLTLFNATGTSNATTFNMTGLPAVIQPATLAQECAINNFEDNTAGCVGLAQITPVSGTVSFFKNQGSAWTNVGTKGILTGPTTIAYQLT